MGTSKVAGPAAGAASPAPVVTAPAPPKPTKGDPFAGQGSNPKDWRVWNITFSPRREDRATVTSASCPTLVSILVDRNTDGIPAFYLPYQNSANYRITLDANGPRANRTDFFLTDLVDGCSVYVEETQDKPTCYHINATECAKISDPGSPTRLDVLAAAAGTPIDDLSWQEKLDIQFGFRSQRMDTRFRNDAAHRPKTVVAGTNLKQAKKVERPDYMIDPDTPAATKFNQLMKELQGSQIAPPKVGGQSVDTMRVEATQGFIFGIRTGINWKFYAQRNVLLEYFHRPWAKARLEKLIKHTESLQPLGRQWIVWKVDQFWPKSKVGRDA